MRDLHAAAVRTPSWVRAAPGIRVILASLMAVLTVISAALSAALPSATSTTSTYEGVPFVYDGPGLLSSSGTAPEAARGSPSRPEAASWESPAAVRDHGVAANTVTTSERISSPLWTAGKTDSAPANALRHFNDHGADFPGLNNSLEYVADAQSFLRSPPSGTLTRLRTNGDVVRYNPGSNTFGVMDSSGAPRTYFRPDPAQHGYPTNLDYFNAQ